MKQTDNAATRYARHLVLPNIGAEGQARIQETAFAIVGVGGLGNPAAIALAAAGAGKLLLIDFDDVDASNLARQWLFGNDDIGQTKADVACRKLGAQFSDCDISARTERLNKDNANSALDGYSVILDCTDNFHTRRLVNSACIAGEKILISGAAIRNEGQLMEFGPDFDTSACYACIYPNDEEHLESCQRDGVLGPLTATIGSMMAARALLRVCGAPASNKMTLIDLSAIETTQIKFAKRDDCSACKR